MNKDNRKRSPIFATVKRALSLIIKSGNLKHLIVTVIWMILGAVTSFTAIFNEKFLNAASKLLNGDQGALKTSLIWLGIWAAVELIISIVGKLNSNVSTEMAEELANLEANLNK